MVSSERRAAFAAAVKFERRADVGVRWTFTRGKRRYALLISMSTREPICFKINNRPAHISAYLPGATARNKRRYLYSFLLENLPPEELAWGMAKLIVGTD
jgi:hypothetical protein